MDTTNIRLVLDRAMAIDNRPLDPTSILGKAYAELDALTQVPPIPDRLVAFDISGSGLSRALDLPIGAEIIGATGCPTFDTVRLVVRLGAGEEIIGEPEVITPTITKHVPMTWDWGL